MSEALESTRDVDKAEQILGQILELLADTEGISAKFKKRAERSEQELLVHHSQKDLEPAALILHNKMRDLLPCAKSFRILGAKGSKIPPPAT